MIGERLSKPYDCPSSCTADTEEEASLVLGKKSVSASPSDSRSTSVLGGGSNSSSVYSEEDIPDDPLDGALYRAVEERFWREVGQHSISAETCPDVSALPAPAQRRRRSTSRGSRNYLER